MFVLGIDTSNTTLSVALMENGTVLGEITEATKNDHSKRLMPAIESLFSTCQKEAKDLDRIVIAKGPGSYTGVRIGVTVAKMMAWTLNKPLVGVSSLEVLARNLSVEGYVIPLFDARRETVFAGVYEGTSFESIVADGHYELRQLLAKLNESHKSMYFLGNDVARYRELIVEMLGDKAIFIEEDELNIPHASKLIEIGLATDPVEDVHGFVPEYHRIPEAEMNWLQEQKKHD